MKRFCKGLSLLLALMLLAGLLALPAAAEGWQEVEVSFEIYYPKKSSQGYAFLNTFKKEESWSAGGEPGSECLYMNEIFPGEPLYPYSYAAFLVGWELYTVKRLSSTDFSVGKRIAAMPVTDGYDTFTVPLSDIDEALDPASGYKDLLLYPIWSNVKLDDEGTAPWPNQDAANVFSFVGADGTATALEPLYCNAAGALVSLESNNTTANPVWYQVPQSAHENGSFLFALYNSTGEMLAHLDDLMPGSLLGVAQAQYAVDDDSSETGYKLVEGYVFVQGHQEADGSVVIDEDDLFYIDEGNTLTLRETPHVFYYSNGASGELAEDDVFNSDGEFYFIFWGDSYWDSYTPTVTIYEVTGMDGDGNPIYDSANPKGTYDTNDDVGEYINVDSDVILIPEVSEEEEEPDWGYWYETTDPAYYEDEFIFHYKNGYFFFECGEWADEQHSEVEVILPEKVPYGVTAPTGKKLAGWDIYQPTVLEHDWREEEIEMIDNTLLFGSLVKANAAPGSSYTISGEYDVFLEPVWADDPDYDPGCSNLSGSVSGSDLSCSITAQKAGEITLVAARYLDGRMDGIQFKTVTLKAGENQFAAAFPGFAKTGAAYKLFAVKTRSFAPLCAAWKP